MPDSSPRRELPTPLRVLCALLVGLSILSLLVAVGKYIDGEKLRWSRVFHAAYQLWAAVETLRLRRRGIDNLITASWFGVILMTIALVGLPIAGQQIPVYLWPIAAWAVGLLLYLRHSRNQVDWIEDEEAPSDWQRVFAAEAAAQIHADLKAPPSCAELAALLHDDATQSLALLRLGAQGRRALPVILETLRDPKIQADDDLRGGLLSLLPEPADPESAAVLAECCLQPTEQTLGDAFRLLASTGVAEYREVVTAGLESLGTEDETAQGLHWGIEAGRRDPAFLLPLLPLLQAKLESPEEAAAYHAYQTLKLCKPGSLRDIPCPPRPARDLDERSHDYFCTFRLEGLSFPDGQAAEPDFDRDAAQARFAGFAQALGRQLGAQLRVHAESALLPRTHGALSLPATALRHEEAATLHASNFGNWIGILDDDEALRRGLVTEIRWLGAEHGYFYAPSNILLAGGPDTGQQNWAELLFGAPAVS